jgi:hypothetical protein
MSASRSLPSVTLGSKRCCVNPSTPLWTDDAHHPSIEGSYLGDRTRLEESDLWAGLVIGELAEPTRAHAAGGVAIICPASSATHGLSFIETLAIGIASYPALACGCLVRSGRHIAAEQHASDHVAVRLALLGGRDPVAEGDDLGHQMRPVTVADKRVQV